MNVTVEQDSRGRRTPEQPMAFSSGELLRGAVIVWATFLGLMMLFVPLFTTISGLAVGQSPLETIATIPEAIGLAILAVLYALVPSLIVMALGAGLSGLIGRALRRVSSIPVHLAVYTLLGAVISAVYWVIFHAPGAWSPYDAFLLAPAVAATVAVPLGWWWNARHALQRDARRIRILREDPDTGAVTATQTEAI